VTKFDRLHDMGDPVGPAAGDRVEGNPQPSAVCL
jgi:hypothetical protein